MDSSVAACPAWLAHHLQQAGGVVPFSRFMDWALNDPGHGYYGSGRARIGVEGDFVTSPSLGSDFAALLAVQLGQKFGGSVITESIFAINGLGRLALESILGADIPTVQMLIFVFAIVFVAMNLLADILNAALDPRIRIG